MFCTGFAGCASVPAAPPSTGGPESAPAPRGHSIRLGEVVRGRIAADGEAHDYVVELARGDAATGSLHLSGPGPERTLRLAVLRRDPMTGRAEEEPGLGVEVYWPEMERGRSTLPLDGPQTVVLRVTSGGAMSVRDRTGTYALQFRPTLVGPIRLGQTIAAVLNAEGGTDDYLVDAGDAESVAVTLEAPYDGRSGTVTARLLRRDPVTLELTELGSEAMVDAESGRSAATEPVDVPGGPLIVRITGQSVLPYGGPYRVTLTRVR